MIVKELTLGVRPGTDQLHARISELEAEVKQLTEWNKELTEWVEEGEKLLALGGVGFKLGVWWADRPWRKK